MWITMLVSGFWHGAAWTFVLWGAAHALFLSLERLTRWPARLKGRPGGRWIALLLVVVQVWVAWVFFRATSLQQALHILQTMVMPRGAEASGLDFTGQSVLALAILRELFYFLQLDRVRLLPVAWQQPVEIVQEALLIVACVYLRGPGSEFIYFQF
jgi:alginate O-acetyltransferase complex protein AlgI